MIRRAALLGAAALAVAALVGLPMPSAAAAPQPYSDCTTSTGTLVAVDFHHWGGPIVRGCDLSGPGSGMTLLNDEGFRTTGTQHDGPQFVCRIGNQAYAGGTQYPTPAQDPCVTTPPASAYWSYWLAEPGDTSWHYSQYGAFTNHPKAGEIQLWIFGGTDIQGSQGNPTSGFPTCSPASLRSANPSVCTPGSGGGSGGGGSGGGSGGSASTHPGTTTHHHTGGAVATTRAPSAAASSRAPGAATTASSARASATSAASSRAPSTVASPAAPPGPAGSSAAADGSTSASPVAIDAKQASTHTATGSALPLALGLALAILFAIGGWWVVRRRRHGLE